MHFLNLNCNNPWLPWKAIYHLNIWVCIIVDPSDIAMPVNSWCSLLWCLLRCSVRLYLKLFIEGLMSYLRYLCFFAHSGVQHILCCVYVLFFFVLFPVSLDCPFLISPSVFSNVSLSCLVDWFLLNSRLTFYSYIHG